MITLAVIIPASAGFHLFIWWPRDRLRCSTSVIHPADLREALMPLGYPLFVLLVSTRDPDLVADQIIDFADLIAIPTAWLRREPKRDLHARALVASRIAGAQRQGPVHHYLAREHDYQERLPFRSTIAALHRRPDQTEDADPVALICGGPSWETPRLIGKERR